MGEYDFIDNLVALTTFRSSVEASRAMTLLERDGINACLGDEEAFGAQASIELLVRQGDLRHAREVLADLLENDDEEESPNDYDADDWSGEDWADDDDDYEPYSEEPAQTPPLTLAWRAALIGGLLLPVLVINLYSFWLIAKHQLWRPQPGETRVNWRFPAALFFNLFGVFFFWLIVRW